MLTLVDDRTRHSELLNRLNTMRISKAFCDVTILVDNKEFLAHKVILASSSDYFLTKFTENAKCDRLALDMNKDTFSLLLNYFYTSNLFVPREKVPGLFVAAKYLKVRRVVKGCSRYLANNLSLDNVMNIREAVSLNNSEHLCHSANEFIKEHMGTIISAPRNTKLNMDIIVDTVPKKESDFHLSELVVEWLEYAIIDGNMTLTDFANENFVLILTKDNCLVQYNEISNHKFSSVFLKDYYYKYSTNQKSFGKDQSRTKSRTKSIERVPKKLIKHVMMTNKMKFDPVDPVNNPEKDVIMISSDDPNCPSRAALEGIGDNQEIANVSSTSLLEDNMSDRDDSTVLLNCENVDDAIDDDDLISNSIRSKMSAIPEEECCVIAVDSSDHVENDLVCLKINCIAKVNGKVVCISLHVKSVVEILNQRRIIEGESLFELSTFGFINGSESTTSGMSSSSVSAAGSMQRVDLIASLNPSDDIMNGVDQQNNDFKICDKSEVIHQYLKNAQNKGTSLYPFALLSTPRCAAGLVNVDDKLIAIGGFNRGECLSSVEIYQPYENKWDSSVPMSTCRARLAALALKEDDKTSVYAIGGSDGFKELATVERFDINNQTWNRVAPLNQARSYHGSCVLNSENGGMGKCVVVGGCFGPNSLRCTEMYDSGQDSWSYLSSMKTGRSQASASSIDDRIFVVGGTDSWKCISSCEFMDIREGKWHFMPELSSPRRGAALVSHSGKLYLFGGSDGQSSLRSFEVFDPAANQWLTPGSQLKQRRANVCGCVLFNKLVAIGGFTGKHFLDTMECAELTESGEDSEWSMFVPTNWCGSSNGVFEILDVTASMK